MSLRQIWTAKQDPNHVRYRVGCCAITKKLFLVANQRYDRVGISFTKHLLIMAALSVDYSRAF